MELFKEKVVPCMSINTIHQHSSILLSRLRDSKGVEIIPGILPEYCSFDGSISIYLLILSIHQEEMNVAIIDSGGHHLFFFLVIKCLKCLIKDLLNLVLESFRNDCSMEDLVSMVGAFSYSTRSFGMLLLIWLNLFSHCLVFGHNGFNIFFLYR